MRTLQGRNNTLQTRELHKGIQAFLVINGDIGNTLDIFQVTMLWSDPGIIQAGSNRINRQWIPFLVLQVIALKSVNGPLGAQGKGGCIFSGIQPFSGRFDANHPDIFIIQKCSKQTHGIGASTDTGHENIG